MTSAKLLILSKSYQQQSQQPDIFSQAEVQSPIHPPLVGEVMMAGVTDASRLLL